MHNKAPICVTLASYKNMKISSGINFQRLLSKIQYNLVFVLFAKNDDTGHGQSGGFHLKQILCFKFFNPFLFLNLI